MLFFRLKFDKKALLGFWLVLQIFMHTSTKTKMKVTKYKQEKGNN